MEDKAKSGFKKRIVDFFSSKMFASFIIPFTMMMCVYAFVKVFPFGKSSVLIYDLNGQYVYFFEALRESVWGDGSLLYSFSRSLGGEFGGIYAYYLASPLSYIVALFPKENLIDALFLILLIKTGLCGLTFSYLLSKETRLGYLTTITLSSCYALSAYSVVMQHNTMWMEGVYLLPLLVVGLKALVYERKYKFYTVTLAFTMLCNYYIGYMSCIFVFIFFFWLIISDKEKVGVKKTVIRFFQRLCRVGVFSAIGIMIAALLIIPAYYSLTFGKTTFTDPSYDFRLKFNPLLLIMKSAITSYDTLQGSGLPFIWCSTAAFFFMPFYFVSKRYSLREKLSSFAIIFILLFSMCYDPIDMIWHGGQGPNCLNYRYAFIFVFFVLYISAKGASDIRRARPVVLSAIFAAWLILFTVAKINLSEKFDVWTLLIQFAFLSVFFALFLLYSINWRPARKYFVHTLCLLTISELIFAGCFNIYKFKKDVGGSSRASYIGYFDALKGADAYIASDTEPFFRTEKIGYRTVNDSYTQDYFGLSGSTSTLNADTLSLLGMFGLQSDEHWSKYVASLPAVDSSFSVKYIITKTPKPADENDPNSYPIVRNVPKTYTAVYSDENYTVYENPYYLPIGFITNESIDDLRLSEDMDCFNFMNRLYSAMLGESVRIFNSERVIYRDLIDCYYDTSTYSIRVDEDADVGKITYTVKKILDSENGGYKDTYLYFPIYQTGMEATLYVNGENKGKIVSTGRGNFPIYLGGYDTKTVEVTLEFEGSVVLGIDSPTVYSVDYGTLEYATDKLKSNSMKITEFSSDSIAATVVAADGGRMLTTIPYDEGWQVTVDGEPVTVSESLGALLSFNIPKGTHTVEMVYMPKCYTYALLISLTGTAVFGIIIACEYIYKRRKNSLINQ